MLRLSNTQAKFIANSLCDAANIGARVVGSFVFGRGHEIVTVSVWANVHDYECALSVSHAGENVDYADVTAFCTAYGLN